MSELNLSIIIPTYNEQKFIASTINRIKNILKETLLYEIIVVNNASTDLTPSILYNLDGIKVIELPERETIGYARNAGITVARSKILAFIDADILISADWGTAIHQFISNVDKDRLVISGNKVSVSEKPSFIEKAWFAKFPQKQNTTYINSGNLVTTKTVCNLIGGFAAELITGEDVDFCVRAQKSGVKIIPDVTFKVYHEGYPRNIAQFFKREIWHGIGDCSSIKTFIQSKVAICSLFFVFCLFFSLILFMCKKHLVSSIALAAGIAFNIFLTYRRFGRVDLAIIFFHTLYLLARTFSIFYHKSFKHTFRKI